MNGTHVDRAAACEYNPQMHDGAYTVDLYHLLGVGVRVTTFLQGNADPLTHKIRPLVNEIYGQLPERHKVLKNRSRQDVLRTFIGLAVRRTCVRNGHDVVENPVPADIPAEEVRGYFAFTPNPKQHGIEIDKMPLNRGRNSINFGSAKLLDVPGKPVAANTLFIPAPADHRYTISHAVKGFPARGRASDPIIAIHEQIPEQPVDEFADHDPEPLFLEEFVTPGQLGIRL
jgi:hypothetical protein